MLTVSGADSRKGEQPSVQLSALLAVLVEELAWISEVFARSRISVALFVLLAMLFLLGRRMQSWLLLHCYTTIRLLLA